MYPVQTKENPKIELGKLQFQTIERMLESVREESVSWSNKISSLTLPDPGIFITSKAQGGADSAPL